jgi:cell division protein FtsW (lipid II flippase)
MKGYDRGSSLFWMFLSAYVCIASLRMGIGTLRNPGMGFMTFGAAGILGILSLVLFAGSFFRGKRDEPGPPFSGILWKRILFVVVVIIGYAKFLPDLGYLISTFLLVSSLFLILKGTRWWWVLGLSLVTTFFTYYIFAMCLSCQFPRGPFGF